MISRCVAPQQTLSAILHCYDYPGARAGAHCNMYCIVWYPIVPPLYPHTAICIPIVESDGVPGPMIQQQGLLWVGLKNSKSTKRCVTIRGNQQSQVSTGYHQSIVSRINIGLVRSCFAHEYELVFLLARFKKGVT